MADVPPAALVGVGGAGAAGAVVQAALAVVGALDAPAAMEATVVQLKGRTRRPHADQCGQIIAQQVT